MVQDPLKINFQKVVMIIKNVCINLLIVCFLAQFCFSSDDRYANLITRAVRKIYAQDHELKKGLDIKLKDALDCLEKKLSDYKSLPKNHPCENEYSVSLEDVINQVGSIVNEYGEIYQNCDNNIIKSYKATCSKAIKEIEDSHASANLSMIGRIFHKHGKIF